MKTLFTLFLSISFLSLSAQTGGMGFLNMKFGNINEDFMDAISDSFDEPDVRMNESGFGIGGSGKFLLKRISIGGGGGVLWVTSDDSNVNMNTGFGYGTVGYNLSRNEEMLIIPSLRVGGFGNTLTVEGTVENPYNFGNLSIADEVSLMNGAFAYGIEVDIIKLFPSIPGLAVGLSGYFMAPFNTLDWMNGEDVVSGTDMGDYTHFGLSLKVGGGGFSFDY